MPIAGVRMTAGTSIIQPEAVALIDEIIWVTERHVAMLGAVLANIYT